jgi:8-oxo-dGTP pyrophosphatase MutT (NUDIX family)
MNQSVYMEKPQITTLEQVSAGGVAFRINEGKTEVAIVAMKPSRRWQLPKGIVDAGESEEQAALREVREEAGIECELLEKIETIEYWYFGEKKGERVRYHKFVHLFLLKYLAGETADHDNEIDEARFVSVDEAIEMLAFKSEQETVKKASELIAALR